MAKQLNTIPQSYERMQNLKLYKEYGPVYYKQEKITSHFRTSLYREITWDPTRKYWIRKLKIPQVFDHLLDKNRSRQLSLHFHHQSRLKPLNGMLTSVVQGKTFVTGKNNRIPHVRYAGPQKKTQRMLSLVHTLLHQINGRHHLSSCEAGCNNIKLTQI